MGTHSEVFDDKSINDHGVPRGACSKASVFKIEGESEGSRPLRFCIGEREDLEMVVSLIDLSWEMIEYLILESFESCPTTHDERIVGSKNGDDVHTLCFELVILLQERRKVPRVTSRLG